MVDTTGVILRWLNVVSKSQMKIMCNTALWRFLIPTRVHLSSQITLDVFTGLFNGEYGSSAWKVRRGLSILSLSIKPLWIVFGLSY